MKVLQPDHDDDPIKTVKIVMPHALHDRMKEIARRRRVMLTVVYEEALRELLDQYDEMHSGGKVAISSRIANIPTGKRVNLDVHESVHDQVRQVASISAVYELAAIEFLERTENYLGEDFTTETEEQQEPDTNGSKQKAGTKSQANRKSGGSRQAGKTRR